MSAFYHAPTTASLRLPQRPPPILPARAVPARRPPPPLPALALVPPADAPRAAASLARIVALEGPRRALNGEWVQGLQFMKAPIGRWRVQRADGEVLLLRATNLVWAADMVASAGEGGHFVIQ